MLKMIPIYLPILKAKPGEFEAISQLSKRTADKTLPFFEISRMGEKIREAKRFKNSDAVTCKYLDEIAQKISDVWSGRAALIDAYQWPAHSTTESGEHILTYIYAELKSLGVDVIPVIGYDRWDSKPYRLAMQGCKVDKDDYVCLRLDSHAIEDSAEPEFFEEQILNILNDLSLEPERCGVLIDFGEVFSSPLEDLVDKANGIIDLLRGRGFKFFCTAGCSLPTSIDKAVKKNNSTGNIMRKEMLLWQTMRKEYPKLNWLFSDYGIRGPNMVEDVIAQHANGKIRYATALSYFIARGHSMKLGNKGAQMYELANIIVESPCYMGKDFSWGDFRILECSREKFRGNSTQWIGIDTNHHITWIIAEVTEFEISHIISASMAT
ncbi:beta family protein [Candidatus Nitrotoga arctica]|uniref:Beta protein n=1 Tax=Candidatus Nitrotoga arctica TaxID=453162 RepID=A0ABM8YZ25_9PROT|nr:beta family protein [Candidatus Nitrotoga arctica]CAG9932745.1 conserved protein of unknown function [Candidatus Nitrotoga arctica]